MVEMTVRKQDDVRLVDLLLVGRTDGILLQPGIRHDAFAAGVVMMKVAWPSQVIAIVDMGTV